MKKLSPTILNILNNTPPRHTDKLTPAEFWAFCWGVVVGGVSVLILTNSLADLWR